MAPTTTEAVTDNAATDDEVDDDWSRRRLIINPSMYLNLEGLDQFGRATNNDAATDDAATDDAATDDATTDDEVDDDWSHEGLDQFGRH